jgi:hypothetical protein
MPGFLAYDLDESEVGALRRWAIEWEADVRRRLAAEERGPAGLPDDGWEEFSRPAVTLPMGIGTLTCGARFPHRFRRRAAEAVLLFQRSDVGLQCD